MEKQNPRLTTGSSAVYHRGKKRSFFLARALVLWASCSARTCATPPHHAPRPERPVVFPSFGRNMFISSKQFFLRITCLEIFQYLSSSKPGHTTGVSGRSAWRGGMAAGRRGGGAAGRGRAQLCANGTVRPGDKGPSYPPRHRRHIA